MLKNKPYDQQVSFVLAQHKLTESNVRIEHRETCSSFEYYGKSIYEWACLYFKVINFYLSSTITMAAKKLLPKVLAFDLDGCVWDPEMYELWGRGGAPFTPRCVNL